MTKKIIKVIIIVLLVVFGFIIGTKKDNLIKENRYVEMKIKDYGLVKIELNGKIAPITVTNFLDLVNDKFYDGLTFHRIIKDFIVQAGDPLGNGTGGSKKKIKGEFSINGVENNLSHKRGVISMARSSSDYNSASSQFFIVVKDSPSLDTKYASFGKVVKGMDIIDKLQETETIDDNGTVLKENQPIIEYIKEIK